MKLRFIIELIRNNINYLGDKVVIVGLNQELDESEYFKDAVFEYLRAIANLDQYGMVEKFVIKDLKLQLANLILLNNLPDIEEKNKKYLINKISGLIELANLLDEYRKEKRQ